MSEESNPENGVEQDSRFPSGPWKGFFLQPVIKAGRSWMDLELTFRDGTMRGEGRDWVGPFTVTGRYELDSGKCWWSKKYISKHDVAYSGYNEGKGIWGVWQIPPLWRGGFHIWPVAMGDPSNPELAEAIEEPELVGITSGRSTWDGKFDNPISSAYRGCVRCLQVIVFQSEQRCRSNKYSLSARVMRVAVRWRKQSGATRLRSGIMSLVRERIRPEFIRSRAR